jgi:hypothetical protein
MRTVTLSGQKAAGRVALVDDADYELVSRYKWHLHEQDRGAGRRTAGPYARTGVYNPADRRTKMILMHVLITGISTGIDHANGNGLDNQRSNLRPSGQGLNTANARAAVGKSSRFKGVRRHREGKWEARIRIGGCPTYLGLFAAEEDAARAYDIAAVAQWGEFARPNFPAHT